MKLRLPFTAAGRIAGVAGCLLGLGTTAAAQTRILFVGNSFTHGKFAPVLNYNAANVTDENYGQSSSSPRYESTDNQGGQWSGIPGIFKKLTDQAGLNYEVHLEALAGKSLSDHYANALSVINQPWDKVVLQELSTGPLPNNRGGNRASLYTYSANIEQTVHAANPAAQLYFYETWARADLTYPSGSTYSGQPIDSMAANLHRGTYAAFAKSGKFAAVAPAGDAWLLAINSGVATRNPYQADASKINLWGSDNYHPSKWASYLNACVLLYTVAGVDPRTLGSTEQAAAALGIAPAMAATLQQLAYQQAAQTPLPVQLVSFAARAAGPAAVALAWQTASEKNSAYFEVERSTDGVTFTPLAQVAAAGQSPTARTYAYTDADADALGVALYYRLRQVDVDGSATYSPVRSVALAAGAAPWQVAVAPNPTSAAALRVQVQAEATAPTTATLEVRNLLGQCVARQTVALRPGSNELTLNTSLAPGLYWLSLGNGLAPGSRGVKVLLTD